MLGQLVDGRYQLVAQLGEGGMGAVYDAVDTRTGRRVAIKVITIDKPKRRDEALRRFLIEARAAGAIDSPHVAKVSDVGLDGKTGVPFLVMERLQGEDLQRILDRIGALEPDVALRVVAQAAAGLSVAHELMVVHRDVKPANLFLCARPDGTVVVKVLDFGVAKARRELVGTDNVGLTSTDHILGTPLYMSPEQAIGMKAIDSRSDVWSLGTVLFAALAGVEPFRGADTLGKLVLSICTAPLPHLQDRAPWVPPEIASVVHRALQRRPEDRYQTAHGMYLALVERSRDQSAELRWDELVSLGEVTRRTPQARAPLEVDAPFLSDKQIASLAVVQGDPALSTLSSLPPTAREGALAAAASDASLPAFGASTLLLQTTSPVSSGVTSPKPRRRASVAVAAAAALALATLVGWALWSWSRAPAAAQATAAQVAEQPSPEPSESARTDPAAGATATQAAAPPSADAPPPPPSAPPAQRPWPTGARTAQHPPAKVANDCVIKNPDGTTGYDRGCLARIAK